MKTFQMLLLMGTLTVGARAWANDFQWTKVVAGEEITGIRTTGKIIPQAGALKSQSANTQGRIISVLKKEGDSVEVGDPLFLVNDSECEALAEEKLLAQKNGVQDLIDAANQREKELGVKVVSGQYEIVSLFKGVILQNLVSAGTIYSQGQQLSNILDMRKLTIELDFAEKYVSDLRRGQKVTFQLASDSQTSYNSTIETIVPTIDPNQRTTIVRLRPVVLPATVNLSELVYGTVQTGASQPILKVPSTSLVFSHDKQYVMKGDENNPVAVEVQVVNETDELSSVRPVNAGELKEGDNVASEGGIFLWAKVNGIYGGG
jgi:multidrug efflux pump subunit AcrA (membrane-fusion protein)